MICCLDWRHAFCAVAAVWSSCLLPVATPCYAAPAGQVDGDRGHNVNMIYPAGAFMENGGPVIDITKEPYFAKGSGDPADADHNTRAFIAFYDSIMSELDRCPCLLRMRCLRPTGYGPRLSISGQ